VPVSLTPATTRSPASPGASFEEKEMREWREVPIRAPQRWPKNAVSVMAPKESGDCQQISFDSLVARPTKLQAFADNAPAEAGTGEDGSWIGSNPNNNK
jgi:hypothetical protein